MVTEHPGRERIPALRQLWQETFGDDDRFLDSFFSLAWAEDHSLCALEAGALTAALYWLDCSLEGRRLAYLYAVATAPAFRRQGICRRLLEKTVQHLAAAGYAGALLVPASPALRLMYARMGWKPLTRVEELTCGAGEKPAALERLEPGAYARLRRQYLPEGGVVQEGRSLDFLATQEQFYEGEGFLLACHQTQGQLICPELLGDPAAAPGILTALGAGSGTFRMPGQEQPFAMWYPLQQDCPEPTYFGLAFD